MRKEAGPRLLAAVLMMATLASTLLLASPPAVADGTAQPMTPIGSDGGWSYFSDPRAVQVETPRKLLYTGWVSSAGSIVAALYDPATHRAQTMVLLDRFQVDDHDNPSVLALPDGRVTYFWSAHNGGFMYYRTTTVAGDIHSFGPLRTLPVQPSGDRLLTYSNPMLLPGEHNRLYLFWRSQYSHQAFATSDDLGEHWSPARIFIDEPGQRPYVKYAAHGDTIAVAFTRSHPDESPTGIYYMSYWRGALFNADGTAIAGMDDLPVAPEQAELVVDPAKIGSSAWVMDVALGADGDPVIVYVTTGSTHTYHYVRFDGIHWNDTALTDAGPAITSNDREPSYSGGISLDHSDPTTVYLSRRVDALNVVEKWQTTDGGATFTSAPVPQDTTVDNLRPAVPYGLTPSDTDRSVWMSGSYHYFTDFATRVDGPDVLAATPTATILRRAPMPRRVVIGTRVRMTVRLVAAATGAPASHAEVTLFQRRLGGLVWSRVLSARTDGSGLVSFRYLIRDHTELKIDWPGDERWGSAATPAVAVGADPPP